MPFLLLKCLYYIRRTCHKKAKTGGFQRMGLILFLIEFAESGIQLLIQLFLPCCRIQEIFLYMRTLIPKRLQCLLYFGYVKHTYGSGLRVKGLLW